MGGGANVQRPNTQAAFDAIALATHELRASTKLALQNSIFIESSKERSSQLFVPVDDCRALQELQKNYQYSFVTKQVHIWSTEKESMEHWTQIDLPEFIAKPIRDSINTDSIKFATYRKVQKQADTEPMLAEIIEQRARKRG